MTRLRARSLGEARAPISRVTGGLGAPTRAGRLGCALVISLLVCLQFAAATAGATPSPPEMVLERVTLANGLRVVLSPDPNMATVSVATTYAVGGQNDPKGRAGTARWLEQLVAAATRHLDKPESLRLIARHGGESGSHTHRQYTQFFETLPASELPVALWLEADRLEGLRGTRESFAHERELLARVSEGQASAPSAAERLSQLVFQGHWAYAHATRGDVDSLRRTEWHELVQFHQRYYAPENAVLSIVGAFDVPATLALIRSYFEAIAPRGLEAPATAFDLQEQTSERLSVVMDAQARTPAVYLGWAIPGVGTREHDALQLVAYLLAEGDSALLPAELVFRRASALGVRAWTEGLSHTDLFGVSYAVAELSTVDSAQRALDASLNKLAWQGPSTAQLERAKAQAANDLVLRTQTTRQRALDLGEWELLRGDATLLRQLPERYLTVTKQAVQQACATYLQEHRRSSVEVYPPGWAKDEVPEVVTRSHLVKAGENLSSIARRYGTTAAAVARANRLDPGRPIHPGQKLVFAVNTGKPTRDCQDKPSMQTHSIKAGENLTHIARLYKTTIDAIVKANGIKGSDRIVAGRKLQVPLPYKPCR